MVRAKPKSLPPTPTTLQVLCLEFYVQYTVKGRVAMPCNSCHKYLFARFEARRSPERRSSVPVRLEFFHHVLVQEVVF